MGRQKRPFTLGRFRLRYPKNYDKGKVYPIEIIYIFGGRTLRRNMNISVAVADWNPASFMLKSISDYLWV